MDLLRQPASLPQLEAVVLLPFGLVAAAGPLWTAFLAVATSAVVWLWRASSSSYSLVATKVAKHASAVPAVTSPPEAFYPPPAAKEPSPESLRPAATLAPEEKSIPRASLPASVVEQDMGSCREKVMWVFRRHEVESHVLLADDEEGSDGDALAGGDVLRSWDGDVFSWGDGADELMDWDEDQEPIRSWAAEEARWWPGKEMRKGDLGWYSYQDRVVISGSVVRLWDGDRSPRRHYVGGSPNRAVPAEQG